MTVRARKFRASIKFAVQSTFMTSIFSIHNHKKPHKSQHPVLRLTYLSLLLAVVAIPLLSRQAFAASINGTAQLYIDGEVLNVATDAKTVQDVINDSGKSLGKNDKVEPSLETEITDGYKINVYRAVPISIQDKGANLEVETAQKTGEAIVAEAGLEMFPEDQYQIAASDLSVNDLKPGLVLTVDRAELINLNLYGELSQVRTQSATVQEFLDSKSLTLQTGDSLLQNPETSIINGMTIEIKNDSREVLVAEEAIPMPEEKIQDVNKDTSYRQVQTPGSAGLKKVSYEIKKENGKEVSRTVLEEVVITPAVKQVVVVGSKKIVTSNVSGSSADWLAAAGIPESNWSYVDHIIKKESGWNYTAKNRSSGAYGLCQALPGKKMATAGSDWETNPITQLKWCNSYASSRYGSWAAAYNFWLTKRWW